MVFPKICTEVDLGLRGGKSKWMSRLTKMLLKKRVSKLEHHYFETFVEH